jgi:8-oxo-dGTP diphosphatase
MKEVLPIARAVVHHAGKILVLQNRSDHENDWEADTWELPGGFVDAHDAAVMDTLHREIEEETGLKTDIKYALERIIVVEDTTWFDCQYFLARADRSDVALSVEHQDYRWIPPERFKELDWSRHAGYTIPVLRSIKDEIQ